MDQASHSAWIGHADTLPGDKSRILFNRRVGLGSGSNWSGYGIVPEAGHHFMRGGYRAVSQIIST
jgi:hypothetical protein